VRSFQNDKYVFKIVSWSKIKELSAVPRNHRLAEYVALVADTVAGSARQFSWMDDVMTRWAHSFASFVQSNVVFTWAVTAFASYRPFGENGRVIPIRIDTS
jgi:hypothetical protein